jgi:ATP-dependent Lhr-like helicase
LGHEGERLYARKNFFELYAVFSAPPVLRVMNGRSEIGYIQAFFLQAFHDEDGPSIFRLGGNAWQVKHVEWRRGQVFVKPATGGRVPRWLGQPHQLSWALCQEILSLLWEPGDEAQWLDEGAQLELDAIRMGYEGLLEPGTAPIENVDHGVQWHTYAGGAVNHLLASALHDLTGEKWTPGNFSLKAKDVSLAEGRAAIRGLAEVDWDAVAADVAKDMSRGAVSKFQPCLPEDEENALLVSKLLDVERTRWFLANVTVL